MSSMPRLQQRVQLIKSTQAFDEVIDKKLLWYDMWSNDEAFKHW